MKLAKNLSLQVSCHLSLVLLSEETNKDADGLLVLWRVFGAVYRAISPG